MLWDGLFERGVLQAPQGVKEVADKKLTSNIYRLWAVNLQVRMWLILISTHTVCAFVLCSMHNYNINLI